MDIGLREWLIIIGIIVIGAIAVDGWRRMRGDKRGLRLKPDNYGAPMQHGAQAAGQPVDLGPSAQHSEPVPEPAPRQPAKDPLCQPYRASHTTSPQVPEAPEIKPLEQPQPVVQQPEPMAEEIPEQDVLIINVRALDGKSFDGRSLLHLILQGGMRFGDMDIFHRHENITGTGEVLFSMANGVRPGCFDLSNIDDFHTPMVSFFMRVPGPPQPRQGFDLMVACARLVAQKLEGELLDERRQPITAQTFEAYRQRILRFEDSGRRH